MKEALDFIEFCESGENEDALYYYLRHFFYDNDYFFDRLFTDYCTENNLPYNHGSELYKWCKFYAINHFSDIAIYYQDDRKNCNEYY